MQLVQGRETNMNASTDFSVERGSQKPTTLTIVQDFPKKKSSHASHDVEMVQGKADSKDFTMEPPVSTVAPAASGDKKSEINDESHPQHKEAEKETLTIVQEFPKKKVNKNEV